ncbi:MAG: glycosyltransferase family 2 protein [Rhodospirillales bacterium]|nr:glycosyltransferase family 2 protein [Rhodospirillales bacterium]
MTDPSQHVNESSQPELAVVVPVHNEVENLAALIAEIRVALDSVCGNYEIIYVDDGSSDGSTQRLLEIKADCPPLRVFSHLQCCGQSAAIMTGIKAARATIIATLDGDGQNDPADIPALYAALKGAPDRDRLMVAGLRAKRQDTWIKRVSSKIANGVRSRLLSDDTPDTGCSLKVFTRAAFMDMPRFDHMHRFLPALMIRRGGNVISLAVNHRPRERGISNYGTWDRLSVGIVDLFGVLWLLKRASIPDVRELNVHNNGKPPKASSQ